MNNAERIARDICLLSGQYERREITAVTYVRKIKEMGFYGCNGCIYKGSRCADKSCFDGSEAWLTSEAETGGKG